MVTQQLKISVFGMFGRPALMAFLTGLALTPATHVAFAAIPWDGEGGDGIWFNPANWNRNENDNITLPPGSPTATDTDISPGTASLNGGLGVIYDPRPGAPFIPVPDAVNDPPPDFSYQKIAQLYISRDDPDVAGLVPDNTVTIRGDLEAQGNVIVGRSSGVLGTPTNGKIIQEGGLFKIPLNPLDLGNAETSARTGNANGTYDYRGGILEVSQDGGSGLRLAAGGSGGVGGIGRFVMHNPGPTSPGYVRAYDVNVAANEGNTVILANGTTNGVGIFEFHSNGTDGTRPVQVNRNLIINNGGSGTGGAVRSARLDLVLDAPPMVDGLGVPQNLGLFDVAFSDALGTSTTGSGTLGDFFSSADGTTLLNQGAEVSAMFEDSIYTWTISYTGSITWSDANAGAVGSISDTGGVDVVLKGLSSMIVPTGLDGDHNEDGIVDAADYVAWRKLNIDGPGGYDDWFENFGESSSGSGGAGGVPEPCGMMLVFSAIVWFGSLRLMGRVRAR
jgi:hypothetical protein